MPAFTGLGSPWWDPYARGTITGLTRGVGAAAHRPRRDRGHGVPGARRRRRHEEAPGTELAALRVDGGAAVLDLLLQIQADQLRVPVPRPTTTETTALGAATLAGVAEGVWASVEDLESIWSLEARFEARATAVAADRAYDGLAPRRRAVTAVGGARELKAPPPKEASWPARGDVVFDRPLRTMAVPDATEAPEGGPPGRAPAVCHRVRGGDRSRASPRASCPSSPSSSWPGRRRRRPTTPTTDTASGEPGAESRPTRTRCRQGREARATPCGWRCAPRGRPPSGPGRCSTAAGPAATAPTRWWPGSSSASASSPWWGRPC